MSHKLSDHFEQSLIIVKPDAVERGLVGEILTRFEQKGLAIAGLKVMLASKAKAYNHYPNTEEWVKGMGEKSLSDYEQYNINPKDLHGTADALKIGEMIRDYNVEYLTSGPIVIAVIEGYHAIEAVRKIVGSTKPLSAAPGTIRGDYSTVTSLSSNIAKTSIKNLIHASGNKEEAEYEVNYWFKKDELFHYNSVHRPF